jgi:hypothetical protein
MWKMVLGLLLLLGTLTRDSFGFIPFSGAESIGFNFASIIMIIGGLYLLYSGYKGVKRINLK